ncbi:MAG TPA: VIT domain-containing protein [Thermoanaerobaculia bacterium]|jgi:tetratricopeptide (TPR) repeat protein|nr:VIT domain-containing protein [Thermoanaerobaculia bacterium]
MSRSAALFSLLAAAAGLTASLTVNPAKLGSTAVRQSLAVPSSSSSQSAQAAQPSRSFRFEKTTAERPAAGADAPIRLTASDGTGLSLVALEADGVLEPPLAFTELHLTFENPREQTMEGRFSISLPPGASLSRFALKTAGGWQEGEVVERQRARETYEDFLHRRQDPALLEQEAGNEFSARVFPILPRARKEIIVSYSHTLARADEPYVLPLHGLSTVGRLDIRVLLGGRPAAGAPASNLGGEVSDRRVVELHKRDWTPDRDFEIGQDRASGSTTERAGLRHGNLAVVRVAAPVESVPEEITGLYVLLDSSASRALGYATEVRRLSELIAGLRAGAGGATPVAVAAFDQEVVPLYEGRADGFAAADEQRLLQRRPLGASDLGRALTWLGEHLGDKSGKKYPRVLLVTDGVATAGETETHALKAAVHALGAHGVERLDVLAVGGLRDEAVLRELATGNLAHDGQHIDGTAPLTDIARRLTLACRSGVKVAVAGATWIWPDTLDGVQPGDQALVYADLPADKPLRLTLDGKPYALAGEPATTERPLLERAWAQARIDRLIHLRETALSGDDDLRKALGLQITELSIKHRVISPFTALLVLETDYDYARFGLDRRALADILTVGPGGLEVLARKGGTLPPPDTQTAAAPKPAQPRMDLPASALRRQAAEEPMAQDSVTVSGESALEGDVPTGVPGRIEGGVEGGVAGGVPGGVAGGVVGGVVGGVPSAPRAPAPVPQEQEARAPGRAAADEAPSLEAIRVQPAPPPPPTPEVDKERKAAPYSGKFAEVMNDLAAGRVAQARKLAESWNTESPGDVLALIALGEAWEAAGDTAGAARAYGSLIDLFPSRADLRRLAGERLERLGNTAGLDLAIDTYKKAVLERPDHPSGHRLLAWALLRAGHTQEAFAALEKGIEQRYPGNRFLGVDRVLREDLGLLAAAWLRAEPGRRTEVLDRLSAHGASLETEPTLRFVLTWETDANDVDLHVYDRHGGHAYYEHKELPSGGALYADVTTGYGPECFTIPDPGHRDAAPYRLGAHYYSRGPMGYGMGTVQIVAHDGSGRLKIEPRPFVVMTDQAMVDLGSFGGGKAEAKGR